MKRFVYEGTTDNEMPNGVKVDFAGEKVCFALPCEVKEGTKVRVIYEIETEE